MIEGNPSTEPVRMDFIDYPTAWRLQREGLSHDDSRCSAVQTAGVMLCDCSALPLEWSRRVREQGGIPNYERYMPRKP